MNIPRDSTGAGLFADLRAEYEQQWLADVYIDSPEILAAASMRSMLVLGESGSGKSALRLLLEHRHGSPTSGSGRLVAPWLFAPLAEELAGSRLVQVCIDQLFAACAAALLRHLGRFPAGYLAAPGWAQAAVAEFILAYLAHDPARLVARLLPDCPEPGRQLLQTIVQQTEPPLAGSAYGSLSPTDVIAELTDLVRQLQLGGVWIMVDGLETWTTADPARVATVFQALLAALALFEVPGFALKIFAPTILETQLAASSGISRRRLDVLRLNWSAGTLRQMVEARLANARGLAQSTLTDLCATDHLSQWLKRYGGNNPRAWLELARPYVAAYFAGGERPLTADDCLAIARAHPPLLHVDLTTDQVFLGHSEVTTLQPATYRLLRYLYVHRARPCTRNELYYRACRELDHEPRTPGDRDYESPNEWRDNMDTMLWRLHKQLEPHFKPPLYVVAVGSGVQLQHAW